MTPQMSAERETIPKMALSIRQPWAWAIVHGGKDIENRDWATRFRGPVAIHAAKGVGKQEYADAASFIAAVTGRVPDVVDRGGIIGVAEIADCISESDSPWFFGRYGFVLKNVRPVTFIPVKGALGFFDWRKQLVEGD